MNNWTTTPPPVDGYYWLLLSIVTVYAKAGKPYMVYVYDSTIKSGARCMECRSTRSLGLVQTLIKKDPNALWQPVATLELP